MRHNQSSLEHHPAARAGKHAALASSAVLLMTVVHHGYGAIRFTTPWRHHVVLVAFLLGGLLWVSLAAWSREPNSTLGRLARRLFLGVALLGAILWIGFFEGGYNHALKILLTRIRLPEAIFRRLYPPHIYEPVEDWIFETTGVAQLVLAIWALWAVLHYKRVSGSGSRVSVLT